MRIILNKKRNRGFTLIEAIVSVAIISVISGVVLFNYSGFNDSVAISSAAQEMVIAIRQAQVYGITVKESGAGTGGFNYSYGIAFDPINYPTSYFIFVDKGPNPDHKFGGPAGCGTAASECVEVINLRNGVRISSICDGSSCPPGTARKSTILFTRPSPDPSVYYFDSSDASVSGLSFPTQIKLSSPKGSFKMIKIERTGQIQSI